MRLFGRVWRLEHEHRRTTGMVLDLLLRVGVLGGLLREGEKMKHTPGPWVVEGVRIYGWKGSDKTEPLIATTAYLREAVTEIGNAHLIAAAPDLLAALEWAMENGCLTYSQRTSTNQRWCDHVDACTAAIAKAKGKI